MDVDVAEELMFLDIEFSIPARAPGMNFQGCNAKIVSEADKRPSAERLATRALCSGSPLKCKKQQT